MWYVDCHASINIDKVIETAERIKKEGVKKVVQESQEYNHCLYRFADGFEYEGKKLEHEKVQELKAIHGKLEICAIRR